ncbi:MAG: maleylacetoacetate isomerase [Aromatoleum sp.]|uniref:maleylacetoacetate isomerase n=1 Tax=Aromatoleum sp. TaxID=2307007 RepID=UPI002895D145|nr:maleylacetoacetate isomerase [Aromatoleum sp.]MDT3669765.1 maleylacetoacetate isomerase [Aromatoleum sp.]
MKLYTYYRSSAAYRVRIALNLKRLAYDAVPVHLVRGGGEQRQADYLALNPAGLVPTLVDGSTKLSQSLAIIEYLDETHPEPALLPGTAADRARIRAIAQAIACDIHPINNLRVLQYLTREFGVSDEQKNAWYRHWIEVGLGAVEAMLAGDPRTGMFCHGATPTLADCCLVPQVFNARRFGCDLNAMPIILGITERCAGLDAFRRATPEQQPDAE